MSRRQVASAAGSTKPLSLVIVEDHELLADSLALALNSAGIPASTVNARDEEEILIRIRRAEPEIVLLDLDLGEAVGSALPLIAPIRALGAEVIMMTGVTDRLQLAECVDAGAIGLMSKTSAFDDLVRDVVAVASGTGILGLGARTALLEELADHHGRTQARLEQFRLLTVRECEVLQKVIEGKNAQQIADDAYLSIATVRSHIKSILHKLDVSSQLAAVALAARAGWSPPQHPQR